MSDTQNAARVVMGSRTADGGGAWMRSSTASEHTTRPVSGLTGKGRAVALLVKVRDRWGSLTPDQRAEVTDLVARLSVALRRESKSDTVSDFQTLEVSRPRVPLVGRIAS
jgi:hypothetical protein